MQGGNFWNMGDFINYSAERKHTDYYHKNKHKEYRASYLKSDTDMTFIKISNH